MKIVKLSAILAGIALALSPTHVAAQAEAKPASLGVALQPAPEGPTVAQVLADRSGAALGLKVGDIIVEAGGKAISLEVFQAYMKQLKAGDQMSFKVNRAGTILELTGKAVAAPEGAPAPKLQQVPAAAQPTG